MDEGVAAEKCVCSIHWWFCGWGEVWGWGGGGLKFLVLYLVILWMSLRGETFHAYPRLIRWTFPQFIEKIRDAFELTARKL